MSVTTLNEVEEQHRSRWESEVVVRRIGRPLSDLCLDELHDSGLVRFLGPLTPGREGGAVVLHVPAIVRLGSLAFSARIAVQMVEWSTRRSELRIVPASSLVALWTESRRRRYFDAVHDVADHLARALDCTPHAA